MNFTGKCVLVTGGGAGIGRAACIAFAKSGAVVAVNSLKQTAAQSGEETVALINRLGGRALFVMGDVSDPNQAAQITEQAHHAMGRLDILVNNAGVAIPGRTDTLPVELFDLTMSVNVRGTFLMSKYALPYMQRQGGGVIVNVASVAALKGHTDRSAYCASKGAVVALSRAMAADHIGEGIRVNCICPGTTMTPAVEEKIKNAADSKAMERAFVARQPLGRLGNVEEIAHAILFACCDEAAYMAGSVIVVDGGMTM